MGDDIYNECLTVSVSASQAPDQYTFTKLECFTFGSVVSFLYHCPFFSQFFHLFSEAVHILCHW